MEKLTVYGLPINPMPLIRELASVSPATTSFCVSYGTRDKLGKQLDMAIELVGHDGVLLVDNGAFSAFQAGIDTMNDEEYLEGYADWANDILDRCPQAIAVFPDVIGGTAEQNAQLINETMMLFDNADRVMPIWHMNEPIHYLLHLCEDFSYVGIGSAGEYFQVGTPKWHARMTEVFAAIDAWEQASEGAYIRPRIHLMRAQSEAAKYPVDSSDSVNVAINHGRYKKTGAGHVERFAGRVNAKIQASAGAAAEHQLKRPLLDHLEGTSLRTAWLLEAAGYTLMDDAAFAIVEPLLPPQDVDAWLAAYHAADAEQRTSDVLEAA